MVRAIAVPVAFVSGIAATYGYTQLSPEQQTELLDTIKGALPAVPLPELPDISAIPGVEQIAWAAGQVKSAVSAVLSFVTPKAPEPAPAPAPAEPSFNAASIIIPTFVAGVALYAYTTTPEGQETVKKVMAASKSAAAKAAAQAQKGVQQLKQAAAQLAEPKSKPAAKPAAKAEAPKKAAEPEKKSQPAAPKVDVAAKAAA